MGVCSVGVEDVRPARARRHGRSRLRWLAIAWCKCPCKRRRLRAWRRRAWLRIRDGPAATRAPWEYFVSRVPTCLILGLLCCHAKEVVKRVTKEWSPRGPRREGLVERASSRAAPSSPPLLRPDKYSLMIWDHAPLFGGPPWATGASITGFTTSSCAISNHLRVRIRPTIGASVRYETNDWHAQHARGSDLDEHRSILHSLVPGRPLGLP